MEAAVAVGDRNEMSPARQKASKGKRKESRGAEANPGGAHPGEMTQNRGDRHVRTPKRRGQRSREAAKRRAGRLESKHRARQIAREEEAGTPTEVVENRTRSDEEEYNIRGIEYSKFIPLRKTSAIATRRSIRK